MKTEEIWKDVIIHSVLTGYEVSSFGRIRERETKKFVEYYLSDKGYCRVALKKALLPKTMKRRWMSVHLMVLNAFSPVTEETLKILDLTGDHIDKIKIHNDIGNLRWLTRSDNSKESHKFGREYKTCEKANRSIYTNIQIENVCELLEENTHSIAEISRMTDVSKDTIGKIKAKKQWVSISEKYNIPSTEPNKVVREYTTEQKQEIIDLLEVDINMPTSEIMNKISLERSNATRMLINRIRLTIKNKS